MIAAAPSPCSARAATSSGSECEIAQSSEPAVNTATPPVYTRR